MKGNAVKIVAAVTAVAAIASAAAFFVTKDKSPDPLGIDPAERPTVVYSIGTSSYATSALDSVYLPTDIGGVYYTADLEGNIAFFECTGGKMVPSALEVKEISTKFYASFENIPVTVKYIEKDGRVCGYGVFTAAMNADVDVYSYAFAKLINAPAGYGNGHLLLVDFEKENFYKPEKIYSEIYNFNLASGKASTGVSMNTRTVGLDGALRNDWTMFTDDFAANLGDAKYFLSSRYYTGADRGKRADIMVYSSAYRPQVVVADIIGLWFVNDENGMHFLRKTEKGFDSVVSLNGEEKVAASFEGDYFENYLQDGKYLINKETLVLTDLMTGESKTLKDIRIGAADSISVSPDGAKIVFSGNGEENVYGVPVQLLVYCTVDGSKEPAVYSEPMLYGESGGFVWLDSSNVMSLRAVNEDGSQMSSVIYAY